MYLNGGGHIISLKNDQSSFQALVDTRSDLQRHVSELINATRENNQPFSSQRVSPEFSLSIIHSEHDLTSQVSEKEMTDQIFDAIVSRRSIVRLGNGFWRSVKKFLKYFNHYEHVAHLL